MRNVAVLFLLAFLIHGCREASTQKPLDAAGQKLYLVKGTIVSRDSHDSTVKLDHEAIPGFMDAMTMDYSVRGTPVTQLPPDGSRVTARLHAADDSFWLTDVKKAP